MAFYLYILKCNDDSYYTGHTDDIERRLSEHFKGGMACYTKKRLPIELVYMQEFPTRYEALSAERQVKRWSRKKKEALIQDNWEELQRLAKKNFLK